MQRNMWPVVSLLAVSLLIETGCGESSTTNVPGASTAPRATPEPSNENTTTDSGEEKPAASVSNKEGASEEVTLIEDEGPLFAKYLEENKGKVILVDCWATWCQPCKDGFPNTVALHEKHQDEGLVVVSVSFDDMGEDDEAKQKEREEAHKFLKEKKANFKNFLARTGFGSDSGKPFGVTLALPAFRVIDRQGKDRLDPKLSHEEIEKQLPELVASLLKEQG